MSQLTRRRALGAGATALVGLAITGVAQAAQPGDADAEPKHWGHHGGPQPFDETYQGRRITGAPSHGGGHHGGGHHGGYSVQIDGKDLHVMQNADGTWISVVNHYETFATPRAVARAAVVELQGASLVPLDV
ncbi:tyrosinase cofactor [Streptomyces sp. NPDC051907]|uniref:apotyrosinase chaperone MelC1 n=1 Tax=Streptomyces sp. NPDC051907 TaxID=3155284 RepID=UPI003412A67C